MLGFEMSANKKYKFAGDITAEKQVKKFADDLSANKLAPEYKSAPVPESLLDDEGVAVIVGKNFDSVVKDAKKDVLVSSFFAWFVCLFLAGVRCLSDEKTTALESKKRKREKKKCAPNLKKPLFPPSSQNQPTHDNNHHNIK